MSNSDSVESLLAVSAVAVIGPEYSVRAMEVGAVLSLFHVPVVSSRASSSLLDDKTKFPYFSRIVPSDNKQVT